MKKITNLILWVLVVCLALGCLVACNDNPCKDGHKFVDGKCTVCGATDTNYVGEKVDYVSQLSLDLSSSTKKLDVTVKNYVDGDTTHFNANDPTFEGGVLKARYLAINTPESTGKIEAYGKTASNFTKETLKKAVAIKVESDDGNWNADSTGSRYLVWVWYKTEASGSWRNLNLEILQEGLAIASNTAQNRYGEICMKALNQAKALKLYCHSGKPDPNMYYGTAKEVTLRELRTNIANYNGIKVAFEGVVITDNSSQGVYVQEFDEETESYNGIFVYYGFSASGEILEALRPGNRVRVVGTCQYYETGGTYQISGLTYRAMKPNDPENTKLISTGNEVVYNEISAEDITSRTISVEVVTNKDGEEISETKTINYAEFIFNTAVQINNLVVTRVYTTTNESSSSKGAMTLTCTVGGKTVTVRTVVLEDSDGNVVTEDYFKGKTINVKGLVESFDGEYQIKLLNLSDAEIVG